MNTRKYNFVKPLPAILFGLFIVLCYSPGINGPFVFDDIPNITENTALYPPSLSTASLWSAATSMPSGPLYRPVSMISFVMNLRLFGADSLSFKLTNILIHILTALALYVFLKNLLAIKQPLSGNTRTIAMIITLLWAVHPLNLTSVLYIVQRMTSLSALFTLLALIGYLQGRANFIAGQQARGLTFIVASMLVFLPLALLSKENAALFPFYVFLIEAVLWRFYRPNRASKMLVYAVIATTACALLLPIIYLGFVNPDWLHTAYESRAFTLTERLLTEPRIIWLYLQLILLPDITQMGLFHDDIILSTHWLQPETTLMAALGLMLLITFALGLPGHYRYIQFGILFFLAGHSMESSFVPLELAHEHRNYLPSIGILIALICGLRYLPPIKTKTAAGLVILAALTLGSLTALRAHHWSNWDKLLQHELKNHPHSPRINFEMGRTLLVSALANDSDPGKNAQLEKAAFYLQKAALQQPSDLGPPLALARIALLRSNGLSIESQKNLLEHISRQPMSQPNVRQLDFFLRCHIDTHCDYPLAFAAAIVLAVQNNPTTKNKDLALLLNDLGILYFNARQYNDALNTLKHAINLNPHNLMFWQNALRIANTTADKTQFNAIIKKMATLHPDVKIEYPND